MYRLFATLTVLFSVCGCAVHSGGSPTLASNGSVARLTRSSLVSDAPVESIEIDKYDVVTCQHFRRPGSRILTAKRCYTVDRSASASQQLDQEKLEQLNEIQRLQMWREEGELERQRRTLYGREAFQ